MSEFANKLAKLPITNVAVWTQINAIIKDGKFGGFQPNGRMVNVSYYEPGDDAWDFADINESKQRAIADILRKHPLGADHFQEWLKNGEVKLPQFNHPSHPMFMQAYLEVHWICEFTQVSHTLHYSECDHNWYWEIQSAAKAEEFSGKSYSASTAFECVLEHLFKINKDYFLRERGLNTDAAPKDSITDDGKFVMGFKSGRVNLTAGEDRRTHRHVVGVKDIKFARSLQGFRQGDSIPIQVERVASDIDQAQYKLTLDGKDVGMLQFDFGHRTIEWDITQEFVSGSVFYTVILSKDKP